MERVCFLLWAAKQYLQESLEPYVDGISLLSLLMLFKSFLIGISYLGICLTQVRGLFGKLTGLQPSKTSWEFAKDLLGSLILAIVSALLWPQLPQAESIALLAWCKYVFIILGRWQRLIALGKEKKNAEVIAHSMHIEHASFCVMKFLWLKRKAQNICMWTV